MEDTSIYLGGGDFSLLDFSEDGSSSPKSDSEALRPFLSASSLTSFSHTIFSSFVLSLWTFLRSPCVVEELSLHRFKTRSDSVADVEPSCFFHIIDLPLFDDADSI